MAAPAPALNQPAPNFEGQVTDGKTVSLASFKGKKLVLYFYPKDDTPGCTKEACNLRDNLDVLKKENIAVLGVSADGVDSHKKFAKKFDLPFPLLADKDYKACKAYGVAVEKEAAGKKPTYGIKRTTFLIDEAGRLVHVFEKVDVTEHAKEILAAYRELAPAPKARKAGQAVTTDL